MAVYKSSCSLGSCEEGILGNRSEGDFMYSDFEFEYEDQFATIVSAGLTKDKFDFNGMKWVPKFVMCGNGGWGALQDFEIDISNGIPIQLCDKKFRIRDYKESKKLNVYLIDWVEWNEFNDHILESIFDPFDMYIRPDFFGPPKPRQACYINTVCLYISDSDKIKAPLAGTIKLNNPLGYQYWDINPGCGGRVRFFSVEDDMMPKVNINIKGSKKFFQALAIASSVST